MYVYKCIFAYMCVCVSVCVYVFVYRAGNKWIHIAKCESISSQLKIISANDL